MSDLIKDQWEFCQNIAQLIVQIDAQGYVATFGDAYRSTEKLPCPQCGMPITYQWMLYNAGRSKVVSGGNHARRLAVDLNIFRYNEDNELELVTDKKLLEPIGSYWRVLDSSNRWGGDFSSIYDPYHFEMNI